jgi:hypothetical protein
MRVDLRRFDAFVPQQILQRADVHPRFEEVGRETVAQRVAPDLLLKIRPCQTNPQNPPPSRNPNHLPAKRLSSTSRRMINCLTASGRRRHHDSNVNLEVGARPRQAVTSLNRHPPPTPGRGQPPPKPPLPHPINR